MKPKILIQTLSMQGKSLVFWTIGLIFLIALYILLYPSIKESAAELNSYIEKMPEAFKTAFLAEGADYSSPLGYISSEIFSQMLPILFLFFAIGFGAGAIAGEEEKGTLDIVLSTPIRRSRLLLEKFAVLAINLFYLTLVVALSLFIGGKFIDIDLTFTQLSSACFMLFLLGLNFGSVALFIGSISGNKGLSIGLTTAFTVASFLLDAFYPLVTELEKIKFTSPFYHYSNTNALINGIEWSNALLLIWITLGLVACAIIGFAKRDLNV